MSGLSLKSILPKGLYGRTVLILILPIIIIQFVVSVVFIQRHFEGVTRQMAANISLDMAYVIDELDAARTPAALAHVIEGIALPLGYVVAPENDGGPGADLMDFGDLTGRNVIVRLREGIPELTFVDLSVDRAVVVHVATDKGPFRITFDRSRVSASNPHQLLVLMVVVSVVMALIAFMFLRNQVRPIRRLAEVAEAFGKGRSLTYHVSGATEVRAAGQAFLDMRTRIERQIEQRTLMLSGVSHDLRTPLTRLKLALSLSEGEPGVAEMTRDVDDMQQMLDEFLAFARGDSLEEARPTDPVELARAIAANAPKSGAEIDLDLPAKSKYAVLVAMRPAAVRRAVENLVANAVRYGAHCRIAVEIDLNEVVFTIEDDGPGIPANARERAVKPFVRLDTARNQDRGTGVGLGLAIATDIASSHGGALELGESQRLGGLKAILRLPR